MPKVDPGTVMMHIHSGNSYLYVGEGVRENHLVIQSLATEWTYTISTADFDKNYSVTPKPFFQAGKTYTRSSGSKFMCVFVDRPGIMDGPVAFGYLNSYWADSDSDYRPTGLTIFDESVWVVDE